jgi:hypothetical protein
VWFVIPMLWTYYGYRRILLFYAGSNSGQFIMDVGRKWLTILDAKHGQASS